MYLKLSDGTKTGTDTAGISMPLPFFQSLAFFGPRFFMINFPKPEI